ncbi:F-box protein SKIP23-like [Durio zibethinus]|uniref:F-box protein SKIP23-like n=1 Tax=Durio zibethinus TaxID=66656 RepID=A0A6P6ADN2_DURZI|nr:F-box protein SKIP23-like [Durio zibethinus]
MQKKIGLIAKDWQLQLIADRVQKFSNPMADWSGLQPELLALIAKRLETRFDVLRFRSVCSSWRSSFPPKLYPLPKCLPSKTRGGCEISICDITRNTFFLVRLSGSGTHNNQAAPGCWLVKIKDGAHFVNMRLLNPLTDSELRPLPLKFPKVLDLANFQVIELGHEYIGRYGVVIYRPFEELSRHYREKVAFIRSGINSDYVVMLALFRYSVQCLGFLRSEEKECNQWTLLENVDGVQDIVSFNGKFYAIEQKGRTIIVDISLNVSSLEPVGSPTSRKFLVQSGDNLLAVEMLFLTSSYSDAESLPNFGISVGHKVVGFRIFRMNEEEQKWDEMESLGDQILFLGLRQATSASASEFCWGRGNLIFYSADLSYHPLYCHPEDRHIFVFDLETATASPLKNCPAYRNLFWPPPEWVTSATTREFGGKSP